MRCFDLRRLYFGGNYWGQMLKINSGSKQLPVNMVHCAKSTMVLLFAMFYMARASFDPSTDSVLFSINWPGPDRIDDLRSSTEELSDGEDGDAVVMTTTDNEKYRCIIPDMSTDSANVAGGKAYTGPDPMDLLMPMFEQTACSYKIEVYWTYELCHGKYLRQYHEEKEIGKTTVKLQEYYLGRYNRRKAEIDKEKAEDGEESQPVTSDEAPLQKVDGVEIPYLRVNYTDGTKCDLTGTARKTFVHYVCQPDGRGEIYSLKEVSSCEYEAVILTSLLCAHPDFQQKKDPVNKIQCHSLEDSPRRPKSLDRMELQNTKGRYNKREQQLLPRKDIPPANKPRSPPDRLRTGLSSMTDKQIIKEFLQGDYCIQGGSGWWKHEFCYGKSITQFHEEGSSKTVVVLGVWNEQEHIQWIEKNVKKRPESLGKDKKTVLHYYGGGDVCDLSGKTRFTEVKLRCKDNPSQPHSVAIYLLEPRPCEYSLVVESPILCPVLEQADNNGLINYRDV